MIERSLWFWGLVLIVGFPILIVALGELKERLQRQRNPLEPFVYNTRILVLPILAVLLVMHQILGVSDTNVSLKLIKTFFYLTLIYTLISLINGVLTSETKKKKWQIHVPNLLFQVARVTIFLSIATYTLASVWKVDLARVAAALGIGSLVIALALQDTLSNLVSGFLLIFERPFQVGDWIRVGTLEGEVIEINWRAVRLKTWDRDVVIIPNGILGKETLYNYTLLDPLHAVRVMVTFSSDDPPNPIKQIIENAALATKGIVSHPQPEARTYAIENLAIQYEVKFFIQDFVTLENIRSEFLTHLYYAVKRHHLNLPFVNSIEYKAERNFVQFGDSIEDIIEYLRSLSYFISIERQTIHKLAESATLVFYGMGEQIIKAGDFDQGFYIIVEGKVLLTVEDIQGQKQDVIVLSKGEFFGERVLLLGEPSPVSVTVVEDLKAIVIQPDLIIDLVQRYPKFSLEMNQFIEQRQKSVRLAQQMERLSNENVDSNNPIMSHPILRQIMNLSDS